VAVNDQNEEFHWFDDSESSSGSDSESSSGSSFVRARMSDSESSSWSDFDNKPISPNLCWLTNPYPVRDSQEAAFPKLGSPLCGSPGRNFFDGNSSSWEAHNDDE
jgi:hypothetical protein